MNNSHQIALEELKADLDEEFGEEAVWIFASGFSCKVFGTFNFVDKELNLKSQTQRPGQLTVDCISATFSMAPKSVSGKEGDRLVISDKSYLVLAFKSGNFETIIPLKLTQNKTHNWR